VADFGMKVGAGMVLAIVGLTLMVVGVGFLAFSIDAALTPSLGIAGAAAVTGGIFVGPPFFWAIIVLLLRRPPPPKHTPPPSGLWLTLFAAIAKETPWIAIVGAGLVAAAELFLATRRRK
jgi:hypothetical protein